MTLDEQLPQNGDLQVCWIPQVPMEPFTIPVATIAEGKKLMEILADYDAFQFRHNIKPDYSNAGWLSRFCDGDWEGVDDEEFEAA